MGIATVTQMSNRVATLMEERLGARGRDLPEKLRRAGRRLPRKVRRAASELAEAGEMVKNAKLQVRVDEERVALAYDTCLRHLSPLGRAGGRLGFLTAFARSVAFSLLGLGILLIAFLVWRGYV